MIAPNVFFPRFFYPPVYSLIDILINEHFGVNVIGDLQPPAGSQQEWQLIFPIQQANEDIQFVGNLTNVGGTNQAFIFRSVTPVTRCCIPFLRVNVPNFGELFPMAGVPYERGLLILCGMDMSANVNVSHASLRKYAPPLQTYWMESEEMLFPLIGEKPADVRRSDKS